MSMPNRTNFLDELLSEVKFKYDRKAIRQELNDHLDDKKELLVSKGYSYNEAEEIALESMGNSREIGRALNKEHNPILGYLVLVSDYALKLALIFSLAFTLIPNLLIVLGHGFRTDFNYSKEDIIYEVPIKEKRILDRELIKFQKLILTKDDKLHIFYYHYNKDLRLPPSSNPGEIYSDLAGPFKSISGSESSGLFRFARLTISDFPKESQELFINYDRDRRSYSVRVDLKEALNE